MTRLQQPQVRELEQAARAVRVSLVVRDIRSAGDLPAAFDAGSRERVEGVITDS
jgi:hypothetical protein